MAHTAGLHWLASVMQRANEAWRHLLPSNVCIVSLLLSDTHRPGRRKSLKDGPYHACMRKKATIHQMGLACLQHPTPTMSVWVVMVGRVLAHIENTKVEAGCSCFMPKLGAAGLQASSASIPPSSKPAILLSSYKYVQGHGEDGGPGTFNLGSATQSACGMEGHRGVGFKVLRHSKVPLYQRLPRNACSRPLRICT